MVIICLYHIAKEFVSYLSNNNSIAFNLNTVLNKEKRNYK